LPEAEGTCEEKTDFTSEERKSDEDAAEAVVELEVVAGDDAAASAAADGESETDDDAEAEG
jgi:hypothetical protein